MSEEEAGNDSQYCLNCGYLISGSVNYCPECGADQDPDTFEMKDNEILEHSGFSSWAIGFRPGSSLRNTLVGIIYLFIYPIGIPLLIYGYLIENPNNKHYFAWAGGGLLLIFGLAIFTEGTLRWMATGAVSITFGLFFLPIVRERVGFGNLPGVNENYTTRRNILTGFAYAIGSLVAIGLIAPESESDRSEDGGNVNAGISTSPPSQSQSPTASPSPTYDVRRGKLNAFEQGLEEDTRTPISVESLFISKDEGLFSTDYVVNLGYITDQDSLEEFQVEQTQIALFYANYVTLDDWEVDRLSVTTYETEGAAVRGKPAIKWHVLTSWVEYYQEGSISRSEFFERVQLSVETISTDTPP